jgi:hypothetical protein
MHPKTKRFVIILALVTFLGIASLIWLSKRQPQMTPGSSFPSVSPAPSGYYLPPFFGQTPSTQPSLAPQQSTPSSLLESSLEKSTLEKVLSQLPHRESGFTIEYFADQDQFIVQINQSPFQKNQEAAKEWFLNQGLDPEILNVLWTAPKEVDH